MLESAITKRGLTSGMSVNHELTMSRTVMVIEDDPDIARLVRMTLEKEGFRVSTAADGMEGYERSVRDLPDLLIVDVMLPGMDGHELCRRFRQNSQTSNVPILILSAKTEELDRVLGLEFGADDYVCKPFAPRELVARVKALLRRVSRQTEPREVIRTGELVIDAARHLIKISERKVVLSSKEFGLLRCLVEGHGRVFSREQLLDSVWGYDYVGGSRTVDVHIRHLREKMPEISGKIVTVKSVGYKYDEDAA